MNFNDRPLQPCKMKYLLKLEEAALFLFSIWAFRQLGFPFWEFAAFILLPDAGMAGYLVNPRIGAFTYNLAHHKGVAVAVFLAGYFLHSDPALIAGLILFAHSCMDRMFGFGLKYSDSFKNTHLGIL